MSLLENRLLVIVFIVAYNSNCHNVKTHVIYPAVKLIAKYVLEFQRIFLMTHATMSAL